MLAKAGFKIKYWQLGREAYDGEMNTSERDSTIQVLGVTWDSETDVIKLKGNLNFSAKKRGIRTGEDLTAENIPLLIPEVLTRRIVLEQTMRIYDPMGLLSPFTLIAKEYLRETWTRKLQWDEPIPSDLRDKWIELFRQIYQIAELQYDRCLKPKEATGQPALILLSDGSDRAYGFAAYIRWKLQDGSWWCRLIMAKSRIAPLKKLSTPQMELNGVVLSKRGRKVIESEMRYGFQEILQLVDSETVLCMLNKLSTRFKLYEGVRVGEVQAATNGDMTCWKWIEGKQNISDWLTRGRAPCQLDDQSQWWRGPDFLYEPMEQWDIRSYDDTKSRQLPGEKKVKATTATAITIQPLIDFSRFNTASRLTWVLARVLNIVRKKTYTAGRTCEITPDTLQDARLILAQQAQHSAQEKFNKGDYTKLKPIKDQRGVYTIGG